MNQDSIYQQAGNPVPEVPVPPRKAGSGLGKGCLIAAVILFVLGLMAAGAGFFFYTTLMKATAPVVAEGERFLKVVGEGQPKVAYEMASGTLRAQQTAEEFEKTVNHLGLAGFQSASWTNRSIKNDRGTLEGTAKTASGSSVPLTIELIKENGLWRVLAVRSPQAGAQIGETPKEVPPKEVPPMDKVEAMALESMLEFNGAITAKSFDLFHAGISEMWRKQTTPAALLEAFKPFTDAGIDLSAIKGKQPVFPTAPAINEEGVLVINGHYPTEPKKTYFILKYIEEEGAWKLFGIKVNVKD